MEHNNIYVLFVLACITAIPLFGCTTLPLCPAVFVQEAQIATMTPIINTKKIIEPIISPMKAPIELKIKWKYRKVYLISIWLLFKVAR